MNCSFFEMNKCQKLEIQSKFTIFGVELMDMGSLRNIKTPWIIHIFAFLHAAVALSCRLGGIEDELLLTILTMTMALIVCLKKGLNIELTAASIIVVNILGYFIGNFGASIIQKFIDQTYAVHALSTFLTTEILGWSILAVTSIFQQKKDSGHDQIVTPYLSWLVLAMCGIFVFRLGIILLMSNENFIYGDIFATSTEVLSNSISLITLICINILYIRYIHKIGKRMKKGVKMLILISFILLAASIESILVGLSLPLGITKDFFKELPLLFITSLLAQITVYCIVFIINYALTAKGQMQEEREKANMAQYRYVKLKQQVNPHFLFNSLNILDCLICENNTERASAYTHKLAGIYRYMLRSENEMVVSLKEELVFVGLYIDLLKERFPTGFEVKISVPEGLMSRYILPCSIQLLIENATKHNAVSEDDPLIIKIEAEGECIKVNNNLIPKLTKSPSTGLGQQYIRQMYLDLTGKQIEISETEQNYCVTLPLI